MHVERTASELRAEVGVTVRPDGGITSLVRPRLDLIGRSWPSYGVFVSAGALAGMAFIVALALIAGVPPGDATVAIVAGLLASTALAYGTAMVTGREVYTFYHYQLVILAAAGGALALLDRPVLPALDLMGPGLALVQAIGRIGCFMAGCCHGRPHSWGVCYGEAHVAQGFARELAGVRLFPVQAIESLCLFGIAGGTAAIVVAGSHAGAALAAYLTGHAAVRFVTELARGDAARPCWRGLSEAQWTAAAVLIATTGLGAAGLLPLGSWQLAPPGTLAIAIAAIAIARRADRTHALLHPRHIAEIARTLDALAAVHRRPGDPPQVARTSLGLGLSTGVLHHGRAHYALSSRDGALRERTARRLAALILQLRHAPGSGRLLPGSHGVFHLLVDPKS
ncbi:MAG TPA: prolipoprotein diacylglyceryl transferase family protein [Vicinamibacterales bacterium]